MAATTTAIKRTLEGQVLAPIGSERSRQPPPPAHGRTSAGEAGCPEVPVPLFLSSHHLCDIAGTLVLEGLSPEASRSRRRQAARAVSWARASGFMGNPASGGLRPTRGRARGREVVRTEDPHLPERVTKGQQLQGLTSSPAGPQRTLVCVVGITLLPTPQTTTTRPWKGRGTGVPDRHLPTARQEIPSPKPHAPVVPGSWRVADGQ